MSSQFRVTKRLTSEGWTVSGEVLPGGTMPREVFVFENTGTMALGEYHSVVHALDMQKVPMLTVAIPVAKAKYVRTSSFSVRVPQEVNPDTFIETTVASLKKFSKEYSGIKERTDVYLIS